MSFETEKRKLRKVWEDSQNNQFTIDISRTVNTIKGQQMEQLPSRVIQLNRLDDIGGGWIDDVAVIKFTDGNGHPYADTIAFQWTITASLPESWIPFVRLNFAYNRPDHVDPFAGQLVKFQYFVGMNELTGLDEFGFTIINPQKIVNATWYATMSVGSVGANLPKDFTGKLYFTFLNPNLFS